MCRVVGQVMWKYVRTLSAPRATTTVIYLFMYPQVCFPGGMVEEARDVNIIETSLREMEEEIGQ